MPSPDRIKEAMETLLKIFQEDNLEKAAKAVFRGGISRRINGAS